MVDVLILVLPLELSCSTPILDCGPPERVVDSHTLVWPSKLVWWTRLLCFWPLEFGCWTLTLRCGPSSWGVGRPLFAGAL